MKTREALIITGYRSYEVGVFQEKDPKIKVLKKVIREALIPLIEEGLKWILIGGNLGIELWAGEVVLALQSDYPQIKLALIFPFEGWGNNWKEPNQRLLEKVRTGADYVNATSHQPYQNPAQLKNHTQFFLEKTSGCLLVYDEEFKGKTDYFLKDARKFQESKPYQIHQITMDDLENAIYFSDSI
ncbi:SLOG family protein [Enterococcus sp. LJL98]